MDNAKQRTDAEWLSALIDDELDTDERAMVEDRLAREPAFAEQLERLSAVNQAVQKAFGEISDEQLPEGIVTLLNENPVASPDRVVTFPRSPRKSFYVPASLAAALMLAVGFFFGLQLMTTSAPGMPNLSAGIQIERDSPIYSLLQSTPSGVKVELDSGTVAEAWFSFATADDRWCRQAAAMSSARQLDFVACRTDSTWTVVAAAESPAIPTAAGDDYVTASRPPAEIDAAVDQIIDGAPLGRDAEEDLIAGDWSTRNGSEP